MSIVRGLLISNPNSTSITDSLVRTVVAELRAVPGLSLRAEFTAHPGHATAIATGLTRRDCDVVVCLGGDGTVNEVANGLHSTAADGHPVRRRRHSRHRGDPLRQRQRPGRRPRPAPRP